MIRLIQALGGYYDTGFDVAWRAAILLGLALLVTFLLRRSSASARHLIWAGAVVGVLILPALVKIVPLYLRRPLVATAPVEELAQSARTHDEQDSSPRTASGPPAMKVSKSERVPLATEHAEAPGITPETIVSRSHAMADWRSLAVATWLVGASVCLLPLLLGIWRELSAELGGGSHTC